MTTDARSDMAFNSWTTQLSKFFPLHFVGQTVHPPVLTCADAESTVRMSKNRSCKDSVDTFLKMYLFQELQLKTINVTSLKAALVWCKKEKKGMPLF